MSAIDLTGQRFGRLVVIERAGTTKERCALWLCRCDCGAESTVRGHCLRRGNTKSCGCLRADATRLAKTRHGHASSGWSPEYRTWAGMIGRCTVPTNHCFRKYGGRGITVCDRWKDSFENFLADMGEKPSPEHSIDRIDFNGNYEPANCRWATRKEQGRNKQNNVFLTINGETAILPVWAERAGVPRRIIYQRLYHGWSHHDAVFGKARA